MRVRELIGSMSEDELRDLNIDLKEDALSFRDRVEERLRELDRKKRDICVTCGSGLHDKENSLILLFGSDKFKKKATFCEVDCLEYFLANLKKSNIDKWGKDVDNKEPDKIIRG